MPFAIFKGEKTMDALVDRLFPPPDKSTKTSAKRAASALLKANPQLSDLSKVPAGSVLVIPETAPPLAPSEEVAAPALAYTAAANRALLLVNSLAQRLDQIDARARAAAPALAALSTGKAPPKQDTADFPDLSKLMPSGKKTLQTRLKALDASAAARKDLFTSLQQQFTTLGKQ
jgi:hypothetical protein